MAMLHIDSSILADQSVTRRLSAAIVKRINPSGDNIVYHDLATENLPAFVPGNSLTILEEFLAADRVIIGAPMYNFSLPSQLKNWIDYICIAGQTFRYTENGPVGLAGGKRVIIALARGGIYSDDATTQFEHLESYLRAVFGFIGIEPEFVIAEGIALGESQRAAAIEGAEGEISSLAA